MFPYIHCYPLCHLLEQISRRIQPQQLVLEECSENIARLFHSLTRIAMKRIFNTLKTPQITNRKWYSRWTCLPWLKYSRWAILLQEINQIYQSFIHSALNIIGRIFSQCRNDYVVSLDWKTGEDMDVNWHSWDSCSCS